MEAFLTVSRVYDQSPVGLRFAFDQVEGLMCHVGSHGRLCRLSRVIVLEEVIGLV